MRIISRRAARIYREHPLLNRYLWKTQRKSEQFNGCAEQYTVWDLLPREQPYAIISTMERDDWLN